MTVGDPPPKLPTDPFDDLMLQGVELFEVVPSDQKDVFTLPLSFLGSQKDNLQKRVLYIVRDNEYDPSSSWSMVCARSKRANVSPRADCEEGLQLRVEQLKEIRASTGTTREAKLRMTITYSVPSKELNSEGTAIVDSETWLELQLQVSTGEEERNFLVMKLAKMIRQKIAKEIAKARRHALKASSPASTNSPALPPPGPSVWSGYDTQLKMVESEPNVQRDVSGLNGRIGPFPVRTYREESGEGQVGEMLDRQ